jgi:hypothetical protein
MKHALGGHVTGCWEQMLASAMRTFRLVKDAAKVQNNAEGK